MNSIYMQRCLDLASLGAGKVSPNPLVGAVLVHDGKIIGEGFHTNFGAPHAEVNCLNSVSEENKPYIPQSTLYVNLEPCCHHGKTPPCTDLILEQKIPRVVVASVDPNPLVASKGIQLLKDAGVAVEVGCMQKEADFLNRRFITFHQKKRPYIILKWARSKEGFMAPIIAKPYWLTNEFSRKLVHKWRSEEDAILIGCNTAIQDNPSLTTRFWTGKNPVRIVLDSTLKTPLTHAVFSNEAKTIVFTKNAVNELEHTQFMLLKKEEISTKSIVQKLYELNIQSVIIEGGKATLQSFIEADLWDEACVFDTQTELGSGIHSPGLNPALAVQKHAIGTDSLTYYLNP